MPYKKFVSLNATRIITVYRKLSGPCNPIVGEIDITHALRKEGYKWVEKKATILSKQQGKKGESRAPKVTMDTTTTTWFIYNKQQQIS
jgi:hypothetical protein